MGIHGVDVSVSTEKRRRQYLVPKFVAVFSRAVLVTVCGYSFGFRHYEMVQDYIGGRGGC